MKPRDLACFNRVADKIGEEKAEIELQKVIDSGITVNPNTDILAEAFHWELTPQGSKFWYDMTVGTNIKWDFSALERDTKVVFFGFKVNKSFFTRMREKFLIRYYKFINRFM